MDTLICYKPLDNDFGVFWAKIGIFIDKNLEIDNDFFKESYWDSSWKYLKEQPLNFEDYKFYIIDGIFLVQTFSGGLVGYSKLIFKYLCEKTILS